MSQRIKLPPLVSLVRLREGRGLDQRGLAAELGVSPWCGRPVGTGLQPTWDRQPAGTGQSVRLLR